MPRNIYELPPELRKLAEQRGKEYDERGDTERIRGAFVWSDTPEGYEFWNDIYEDNEDKDDDIIVK